MHQSQSSNFELRLVLVTSSLYFHKSYSFLPTSVGAQIEVGGWRRNDFCFTIAKINYLVVGLFHKKLGATTL